MKNEKLSFEEHLLRLKRLKNIIVFFDDSIELELSDIELLKSYREIALTSYKVYKNFVITKYETNLSELRFLKLVEDHEVSYL
jgi:hypothetical protein